MLGITGEQLFPVEPLPVVDPDARHSLSEVLRCPAVVLFAERAAAVDPGFAVTEANADAVTRLVHRLDGLPFAIELAAARPRTLTPHEILDGLTDRFALLTTGSRTALPRPLVRSPAGGVVRPAAAGAGTTTHVTGAIPPPASPARSYCPNQHRRWTAWTCACRAMDGVQATRNTVAAHPGVAVVAPTTYPDNRSLFAALRVGARGHLTKDAMVEKILAAPHTAAGGTTLAPRRRPRFAPGNRSGLPQAAGARQLSAVKAVQHSRARAAPVISRAGTATAPDSRVMAYGTNMPT